MRSVIAFAAIALGVVVKAQELPQCAVSLHFCFSVYRARAGIGIPNISKLVMKKGTNHFPRYLNTLEIRTLRRRNGTFAIPD